MNVQSDDQGFIPLHGQPLDIESTLFSGQTFRWRKRSGWYEGVLFGTIVRVREGQDGIMFAAADHDMNAISARLRDYCSLDVDLNAVYSALSRDRLLRDRIDQYRGMRVLRQSPWETTLAFLCAQNSNVPRITQNVEDICKTFGEPTSLGGGTRHRFPTPEVLAEASEDALRELGLGYRARFIASVSKKVARGDVDLCALRDASYDDALDELTSLDGIGDKVANCILLFSMDKPEAFPVDTHIMKAIRQWYPDAVRTDSRDGRRVREWAQERFGPFAGYANHYLFHSRRMDGQKASRPPEEPRRSGQKTL